jgi:hypothetical protein
MQHAFRIARYEPIDDMVSWLRQVTSKLSNRLDTIKVYGERRFTMYTTSPSKTNRL